MLTLVAAMPGAREELKQALGDADDAHIAGLESIARTMMAIAPYTDLTRELLARLGDRWSAMLLMLLATGPLGHNKHGFRAAPATSMHVNAAIDSERRTRDVGRFA
jgi:hypothetical protein